jgi:hypothetical protein
MGTGIRSFAKLHGQMQRFATTGIAPWQTPFKWTAECQALRPDCQEHAVRSGLWQSAFKLIFLSVAICSTVILFVAIHGLNAMDFHNPQNTLELNKRLNSSSRHFYRESSCLKRHIFLPRNF